MIPVADDLLSGIHVALLGYDIKAERRQGTIFHHSPVAGWNRGLFAEGELSRQEKWSRTQTATVIGSFVLSIVWVSSTAVAQQQERRGSQMQPPSQQGMTQRHNRDIEDRVELRLARSSALGLKQKVS